MIDTLTLREIRKVEEMIGLKLAKWQLAILCEDKQLLRALRDVLREREQ